MPVTVAPSTEACEAIRDRINSGGAYTLATNATIAEQFADQQQAMTGLMVDVVPGDEIQLARLLDVEDKTEHTIYIEIRKKLADNTQALVDAMKLIVAQVWQRVNNYDSADKRVRVWEAGFVKHENPNKKLLSEALIFRSRIALKVKVEASA